MVVDERSRHQLYQRLQQVLGDNEADALMAHLPPVGWADVATKQDLAELERRMALRFEGIDLRFDALEPRFDALEHRLMSAFRGELNAAIQSQTRTLMLSLAATVVAISGLGIAALNVA